MKISKLHIDQFRHLENLDFDFTYQSGDRKGQPLDKICFIGQSATGKTGLLELIQDKIDPMYNSKSSLCVLSLFYDTNYFILDETSNKEIREVLDSGKFKLIYFPSELNINSLAQIFEKNYSNIFNDKSKKKQIENEIVKFLIKKNIKIDKNIEVLWDYILFDLQDYSERLKQLGNMISSETNPENISKILEDWKTQNPNPYTELGEVCLNPILKKLNLELSTALEKNKLISIKSLTANNSIPTNGFSTGTKQLLLTALPLFKLDTKDAIILMDEPERSLYPDMQMDLMEYYQNLAPHAQFIVATHSPFIAASFEAEERFILYFDEEGKVAVRRGTSPIGDDPNDILKNDFKLESLMNNKGIEAFEKYRDLKKRIASENSEVEKDKLLEEILSLANAYKF